MRIALSSIAVIAGALLTIAMMLSWERPPMETAQLGYRGTGMEQVTNPRIRAAAIEVPEALYPPEPDEGPRASELYENVQVLGDLSDLQFNRLMAHITEWVSPEEGCGYCHDLDNLASDEVYTKIVARSMLQMTWDINQNWDAHVGEIGVTCYTCHLGEPVPQSIWFENQELPAARGMAGGRNGQNVASEAAAFSSLPYDALSDYLVDRQVIRVLPTDALPSADFSVPIQDAESTYGLMMHMSDSLGVNCTFCHNTRSFSSWESSPVQRTTAWHGINMVREINQSYLLPLEGVYPPERLGPAGDVPKAICSTCHNGVNQPLGGINMLQDHPELAGPPQVAETAPETPGTAPETPGTEPETPGTETPADATEEDGIEADPVPGDDPADTAPPADEPAAVPPPADDAAAPGPDADEPETDDAADEPGAEADDAPADADATEEELTPAQ